MTQRGGYPCHFQSMGNWLKECCRPVEMTTYLYCRSDLVYGRWKLLWASDNSEVANATKRLPLPSESIQASLASSGLLVTCHQTEEVSGGRLTIKDGKYE